MQTMSAADSSTSWTDQDAALQGARPIELLMDYLLAGEKPETDRILACIDIRNRYNV